LTVPSQRADLSQNLRVSGQVHPIRQVNISPREAGILAEVLVEQGDFVEAGQLLARMDYGDLGAGLQQAQGRLGELQARLAELEAGEREQTIAAAQARWEAAVAELEWTEQDVERFRQLQERGAIALGDLDRRQATLEQRRAEVKAAAQELERLRAGTRPEVIRQVEAQIAQAQAQVQQQQSRINDTEVRAPFAGIVVQRYADAGAFVAPTTSASTATAASSSSILALAEGLEIRADVPEALIGQIEENQRVEIRSVSFPDQVVQGRVQRIAPSTVVVQEVTIFRVTITPIEAADILRIGMNVSVDFVGDPVTDALTVPAVALIYQDNQAALIVWDPLQQQPQYRLVATGVTQGGLTEIRQGLEPGEKVFTALPPGQTLEELIRASRTDEEAE
jgi:HlyD family secretion protein